MLLLLLHLLLNMLPLRHHALPLGNLNWIVPLLLEVNWRLALQQLLQLRQCMLLLQLLMLIYHLLSMLGLQLVQALPQVPLQCLLLGKMHQMLLLLYRVRWLLLLLLLLMPLLLVLWRTALTLLQAWHHRARLSLGKRVPVRLPEPVRIR